MTLTAWIRIASNPGDDGAIVAKLGGTGWQLETSPDTGVWTFDGTIDEVHVFNRALTGAEIQTDMTIPR